MIRQLRAGEAVPMAPPRRYRSGQGYIRLRWTVAPHQQVEVYEHRVVDGRVTTAEHVHHRNRRRDDNRPENLAHLSAAEHAIEHAADDDRNAEIVRLYGAGISTMKIAAQFDLNNTTVRKVLLAAGLRLRKPSSYASRLDLDRVRELHAAGVRVRRMAVLLGAGPERINRALDQLGLPRFRTGRPPSTDGTYVPADPEERA